FGTHPLNSPKRHGKLVEMQAILEDRSLELVRAGDTRWTSNFRAIRAIRSSLEPIVLTLQDIHVAQEDLSSEAAGLLVTFQNQTSILLLFAVEQILQRLNILTLQLQSTKLTLHYSFNRPS
ncbi:hypothetical protein Btru_076235, partial [Bulinus truncatus]